MSLESYLRNTANLAVIGDSEKESITRSIAFMQRKLQEHFGADIVDQKLFGSYTRGTILPRYMDAQSDIDYMVVFRDGNLRPQTYLDRLRRFVESTYSRSDIQQSSPTIQLELNHIRFELVPAIRQFWGGLQIPDKSSQNQGWMATDPNGFNQTITAANQANGNLIKPLARVVKYWNARAGYPFESYGLEQKVAGHGYMLTPNNLSSYFCEFMSSLDLGWFAPQWKTDKIERARTVVLQAKQYQRSGDEVRATSSVKQILPELVR